MKEQALQIVDVVVPAAGVGRRMGAQIPKQYLTISTQTVLEHTLSRLLEVDCLNGAPGVYSARFSGENATDEANLDLLLEKVRDVPQAQRTARYWCVLVLMRHADDPTPLVFQRSWNGEIISEKRGSNGFGYDPSFLVPLMGMTAAEMEPDLKNKISHRGQAMADMLPELIKRYG